MVRAEGGNVLNSNRAGARIRPLEGRDLGAVAEIIRAGYGERSDESLEWALLRSPVFRADLSAVAEVENTVVGCWLTTLQNLKIAPGFVVPAASGLVVVHPDYRRLGIGTSLYMWRRSIAREGEALVGYGVAAPETRRFFWSKVSGAPLVRDCGTVYTKLLSVRPVERFLRTVLPDIGRARSGKGGRQPLHISFDLSGIVPFCVQIEDGGISICQEHDAQIHVWGEVRSLRIHSLLLSLLTMRLRVSGKRHALRLLPVLCSLRKHPRPLHA